VVVVVYLLLVVGSGGTYVNLGYWHWLVGSFWFGMVDSYVCIYQKISIS